MTAADPVAAVFALLAFTVVALVILGLLLAQGRGAP